VDASVDQDGGRKAGRAQERFQEVARDCHPWAWADAPEKSGVMALASQRRRLVLRRRVRLVGADAVPAVGPDVQQLAGPELGAPEAEASAASEHQHRQGPSREEWLVSEQQRQARMEPKQRAPELQTSLPQGQPAEQQELRVAQASVQPAKAQQGLQPERARAQKAARQREEACVRRAQARLPPEQQA